MKLRIMSDLHLEFMNTLDDFDIPAMPDDKDTVLILAGDITSGKQLPAVFEKFADRFKAIIFVYGNHEFYGGNMPTIPDKVNEAIKHLSNVYPLDPGTVEIDGVHFVCATLWTDMDNLNQLVMYDAGVSMNDYKKIRTGPASMPWKRKLRPVDTTAIHIMERNFMFETITPLVEAGKTVVAVSHHLPSYQCISKTYSRDRLNGAYASELFEQVADSKPVLWVHGHTHESHDFMLTDDTRVVCNPRGYWPGELNNVFDIMLTVEV